MRLRVYLLHLSSCDVQDTHPSPPGAHARRRNYLSTAGRDWRGRPATNGRSIAKTWGLSATLALPRETRGRSGRECPRTAERVERTRKAREKRAAEREKPAAVATALWRCEAILHSQGLIFEWIHSQPCSPVLAKQLRPSTNPACRLPRTPLCPPPCPQAIFCLHKDE